MNDILHKTFILFACMVLSCTFECLAEDTVWHGYYDGDEPLSEFGTGMQESYDCAVFFSGETGAASGKAILGVRFMIQGMGLAENLNVWLSTNLPKDYNNADCGIYEISTEALKDGDFVELELPTPLSVPKTGIYVGYSFSTKEPFPIFTTQAQTSESGGFFMKTSKSYKDWKDFSQFKYGNLALQVKLDGSILGNAAAIYSLPEVAGLTGSSVILPLKIISHGIEEIDSIKFSVTSSDGSTAMQQYTFPQPIKTINEVGEIPLEFHCAQSAGIEYKKVEILSVNGKDNEWTLDTSRQGAVITLDSSMSRSTVMEEFTGTWCGWCPRGAVGIQALSEDFGNEFIAIAIHRNDPMEIPEYAPVLDNVSGFPSCELNRSLHGDPFYGSVYGPGQETSYGIYDDVLAQQSELVAAKAGVYSEWVDEEKLVLRITAECELGYSRESDPAYRLMYVVLADSLYGDSGKWFQNNDFHLAVADKYKTDPYLGWLTEKGSIIRDVKYNDVAIAAAGVVGGFPLLTDGIWQQGKSKICGSYDFELAGNELVQDKNNLKAVVILLDGTTGKIVNAAAAHIGERNSSDVTIHPADYVENPAPIVFDISGVRLTAPKKGVNIVKYADGTTKKIFIK